MAYGPQIQNVRNHAECVWRNLVTKTVADSLGHIARLYRIAFSGGIISAGTFPCGVGGFVAALSGRIAEVVAERAAEPMGAPDISGCSAYALRRLNQPVCKSLMVSLCVIVSEVFANSVA